MPSHLPARASLHAILLLPFLCLAAAAGTRAATVTDDTGVQVTLPAPAQRVVSLAPHLTELVYALGAGDRLVATVDSADFPPAARDLPRVGDSAALDMERLLALSPDLVLAWQSGNGSANVTRLRSLGIPLFVSEPGSLAQIADTLGRLGILLGIEETGARQAGEFMARLSALKARAHPGPPVRVLYQIWGEPLFTVGGRHVISRIIELCGGQNVFADLSGYAAQVDVESVLARDPELIVASGADDARPPWLDEWQRWPGISAVKHGHVGFIPPGLIQRHSSRVLDGAEMMCRMIDDARHRAPLAKF